MVARDGGTALCQRVRSSRYFEDAGWSHKLAEVPRPLGPLPPKPPPEEPRPDFDVEAKMAEYREAATDALISAQAKALGIDQSGLELLGVGYDAKAHALAFPMKNGRGEMIGIRLRSCSTGEKWAVTGSRNGLFLPDLMMCTGPVYIVEGPTDAAAMLSLGLDGDVIGRPFARGGVEYLKQLVNGDISRPIVIIHDNDPPDSNGHRAGLEGAESLARELGRPELGRHVVKLMMCPGGHKDPRQWVSKGKISADAVIWAAANVRPWRAKK